MGKRIAAIVFIYLITVFAWLLLGATVNIRTCNTQAEVSEKVGDLWGSPLEQKAPVVYYQERETTTKTIKHQILPDSSQLEANFKLDYRKKGLLWYSTYKVFLVENIGLLTQKIIKYLPSLNFTSPKEALFMIIFRC